jgi:hypothetical protein
MTDINLGNHGPIDFVPHTFTQPNSSTPTVKEQPKTPVEKAASWTVTFIFMGGMWLLGLIVGYFLGHDPTVIQSLLP